LTETEKVKTQTGRLNIARLRHNGWKIYKRQNVHKSYYGKNIAIIVVHKYKSSGRENIWKIMAWEIPKLRAHKIMLWMLRW
jgi:hypothetical protein